MKSQQHNTDGQQWELLVLLLKKTAREKGITQHEIAERTGLQQGNVARTFALKYCPTLKTFIQIARALDVELQIGE